MDACLMANVEVAYELRKSVNYLVASEELVPGHSWPYTDIFGALRAKPTMGGAEFAKLIVDRYVTFYTANPPAGGDVTKIALDLSRIDEVVSAINQLAETLRVDMSKVGEALWQAQRGTGCGKDGMTTPAQQIRLPPLGHRVTREGAGGLRGEPASS